MVFAAAWTPADEIRSASVCKKNIPEITLKNLSPPYKNYTYFQNREIFPFEFRASSFSRVNAWWLAEASALAYADETFVRQQFEQAGLELIKFINRSSTQCFIAADHRFAIIAFRGSEIWKRDRHFDSRRIMSDLKTDIDIRLSEWRLGAKVHSGFKAALEAVWDELHPEIEKLQSQGLKIWLTGHSLGAALATLTADRLQCVQGLYTFGSPKVGDQTFAAQFRLKAFRLVNGNDIVPRVPPSSKFRHVGELKWIGARLHRNDAVERSMETSCTAISEADGNPQSEKTINSSALVPSAIRDHVPLLYSVFLWNELIEIQGADVQ